VRPASSAVRATWAASRPGSAELKRQGSMLSA
jgi:hypothetical protein